MSLIQQSDVKNHLSPHFRTRIHLCPPPASEPDATGFSEVEPEPAEVVARVPAESNLPNPVDAPPAVAVSVPGNAMPRLISKSEQK